MACIIEERFIIYNIETGGGHFSQKHSLGVCDVGLKITDHIIFTRVVASCVLLLTSVLNCQSIKPA